MTDESTTVTQILIAMEGDMKNTKTTNVKRMPRKLLRWAEVYSRIPISRSHAHALAAQGKFPRPVKLVPGGRSSGWFEDEIEAHISVLASQLREGDVAA
jgi:predicted DNA-binding transcriptional regulator AlpA